MLQGHERAEAGKSRGKRVPDGKPDTAGRRAWIAGKIADAAHRLADGAIAGARGIGPGLPIARDANHDEARIFRRQVRIAKSPFFQRSRAEIFQQKIGFLHQALQQFLPARIAQIQRDRLLVAGNNREPQRLAAPPLAHRIARSHIAGLGRRLDLDDFGTMIRHQLAAKRPGDQLPHLDKAQTVECSLCHADHSFHLP